jgi:Uma2 family endonuclease
MGRKRATLADLEALPEHLVGELLDGELHVSPRPAVPHALAASVLGWGLVGPFQVGVGGPGGWFILDEPSLALGEDVLVPDLAGWRRERVPELPRKGRIPVAPDWLCEVLSSSTAAFDRGMKLPVYARAGIKYVWLVDPAARTLEVLRLEGSRYTLLATYSSTAHVRAEPFEAAELRLGLLWEGVAGEQEG